MGRAADDILADIDRFSPDADNWLPLDDLLAELWAPGVTGRAIPTLFGLFERFPDETGGGVLWGIVHGVGSLDIDYESALRESLGRQESHLGRVMLDRLERSKKK